MALAIDGVALHPVRMPLGRTVRWASSSEAHADYMILELRAGGLRGVAEGCVKLNFAATTLKVLAAAFEDIFTPRLLGTDALDAEAVARALAGIRDLLGVQRGKAIPAEGIAEVRMGTTLATNALNGGEGAVGRHRHERGTGINHARAAPGAAGLRPVRCRIGAGTL